MSELFRLDLDAYLRGEARARRRTAEALRAACETSGFFYVDDHGVPSEVVAAAREQAARFFALPLERKLSIHFEKARKQRGYVPLRAEATASSPDPSATGDRKEALDFTHLVPPPPRGDADPAAYRMCGPNQWPEGLPGFRESVEAYLGEMIRLGHRLFDVLGASLGLPEGHFGPITDRPIAQLRFVHYPPGDRHFDPRELGIGAHCDYECFTILHQDDVGGLEILDRDGSWTPVPPREEAFTVNLGEMMERWTNGRFRATPHRVVPRPGAARLSIPFFFGTNYEAVIECLPTCRYEGLPPRFAPVGAGEYLAQRLGEIYGSLSETDAG